MSLTRSNLIKKKDIASSDDEMATTNQKSTNKLKDNNADNGTSHPAPTVGENHTPNTSRRRKRKRKEALEEEKEALKKAVAPETDSDSDKSSEENNNETKEQEKEQDDQKTNKDQENSLTGRPPPSKRQRIKVESTSNTGEGQNASSTADGSTNANANAGNANNGATRQNKMKVKRKVNPVKKKFDGVGLEELECVICKEYPPNHIYQCSNGHFLCRTCHKQIRESKNSICPICRVRISRRAPARNRLAEKYLASLEMECSNGPCKTKLQFAYLKQHVEHECLYRTVMCKYEPLGCDWKGLAKDSKKHKKMCTTRELNASQLLRQVMAKNAQENNERERLKQIDNKYIEVTKIWESRCRNIVTRDVVLESGQSFDGEGVIHSRPFHALHHSWVVEIKQVKEKNENNKNNVETTRLKLRLGLENESKLRHRLLLHTCVLRGPDTSQEFHPITFECEINRKDLYSQWVDFPIVGSMSSFAESLASEINLRVVLVDKRRGEVSHSFRADDDRGTSESSFEVENYSDARSVYSEASCSGSESLTAEHSDEYSDLSFDI